MHDPKIINAIMRHLSTQNYTFEIGPFAQERDRPKIDASDDEIEWHLKYLEETGHLRILHTSGAGCITVDRLTPRGIALMQSMTKTASV